MTDMIYTAVGNQVFAHEELFLTIHPTDSGLVTMERQAELIAGVLNAVSKQDIGEAEP